MSTKSANKSRSIKSTDKSQPMEAVEVRLTGPGVTTLGLVDPKGNVLFARRVAVSGPAEMETNFQMPLSLSTLKGQLAAVPMLFHQINAKQVVTIGGKDPAAAATERQRALKLDAAAVQKIKTATEAAAAQISRTGRLTMPPHQ
jgi:hypothetical protein